MRYLIVAVALVALFPLTASAQSLEGLWQRTQITIEGGGNTVISTQPGLVLFANNYAAVLEDNGQAARSTLGDSSSDDELLAALRVYTAAAGPYEMNGSTLTFTPTSAANPNQINTVFTLEITFDGNDSMTSVLRNEDTGGSQTRTYVRVK